MSTLFINAVIILCILGATWLVVQFIISLFSEPKPTESIPSIIKQKDSLTTKPQELDRLQILKLVRREIVNASEAGQIGPESYHEMVSYIEREQLKLEHSAPGNIPDPSTTPLAQSSLSPTVSQKIEHAAAAPPKLAPRPVRDPASIRAAIAKLHAHAQAPEEPRTEPAAIAPVESSLDKPSLAKETVGRTFLSAPAAGGLDAATLKPLAPKRPLGERLFTAENIRILQSIGILIIFVSSAAFIKNQFWMGASNWDRIGLLVAGTALCYGLGYALFRWLSLRITGMGFLILGHLAMILDALAALVLPGTGRAIYPYAPESLWLFTFLIFTATAIWHSRKLNEPLFDAFTLFGGLAAWTAGALWCGVDKWLLPAAFVPALFATRYIGAWLCKTPHSAFASLSSALSPEERGTTVGQTFLPATGQPQSAVQRWRLPWWLMNAWQFGSNLLAVILPAIAVYSGRTHFSAHFAAHAVAMLVLAAGLLFRSKHSNSPGSTRMGALLLLTIIPCAAYAFEWPLATWSAAFALPGASIVLITLLCSKSLNRGPSPHISELRSRYDVELLTDCGLHAIVAGMAWAISFRLNGAISHAAIASALAAMLGSLVFALLRKSAPVVWLTALCAAFLAVAVCDQRTLASNAWPVTWLLVALLMNAGWALFARRKPGNREDVDDLVQHGHWASDALAMISGMVLLTQSPVLFSFGSTEHIKSFPIQSAIAIGWAFSAIYALATSCWISNPLRRSIGTALISPALAYGMYHAGFTFGEPAAWLGALALLVTCIQWLVTFNLQEKISNITLKSLLGTGCIMSHGVLLASFQMYSEHYLNSAIAFVLLAAAAMVVALRQRHPANQFGTGNRLVTSYETSVLYFLAAAGVNIAAYFGVCGSAWPGAFILISALIIPVGMLCEALSDTFYPTVKTATLPAVLSRRFYLATGVVAQTALLVALFDLLCVYHYPGTGQATLIGYSWTAALVALFVALRPDLSIIKWESESTSDSLQVTVHGVPSLQEPVLLLRATLAIIFSITAGFHAIQTQFWLSGCNPDLRMACILFFVSGLLVSLLVGMSLRRSFAPVTGVLASLGLAGCAYGVWQLPVQSFGLCCGVLAFGAHAVAEQMRRQGERRMLISSKIAQAGVMTLGTLHLSHGLVTWPADSMQAYAAAGWAAFTWLAWSHSPIQRMTRNRALFVGLALAAAACHLLRCAGLQFAQFGPGLSTVALMLLGLREIVMALMAHNDADAAPPSTAPDGFLISAMLCSIAGLTFGVWGDSLGYDWLLSLTLLEVALFAAVYSVLERREQKSPDRFRLLVHELYAWLLLAMAVGVSAHAANLPLTGACWPLVGALFLMIGMAGESLAGAILGAQRQALTPTPFLESRHMVALGICAFGLLTTVFSFYASAVKNIEPVWQVLFGATVVAIYTSLARWSTHERWDRNGRLGSAFVGYVLLTPATYLCFLQAHSTGSSWGALWFIALAPVLLVAVYILKREKLFEQANLAKLSAVGVNMGSLILAFAGNRGHLAVVPCCTFLAIAAQALAARIVSGNRNYSWLTTVAVIGAAFLGLRALLGDPGQAYQPWRWETPALSAIGLVMVIVGGVLKIEEDPAGRSLVGISGAGLNMTALLMSLGLFVAHIGSSHHSDRFDHLIICILLFAGMNLAAQKWLKFLAARFIAPIATLAGYFMCVLKEHVHAWEWYTLPAALFIFIWARQQAREDSLKSGTNTTVNVLAGSASGLALLPSFIQALPYQSMALNHYFALLIIGFAMIIGAMLARRKIPLLSGSSAIVILTTIKAFQWTAQREKLMPLLGIALGFLVLAIGSVFEAHMNRVIMKAVDRAKEEARLFWVSWQ